VVAVHGHGATLFCTNQYLCKKQERRQSKQRCLHVQTTAGAKLIVLIN